MGMNGYKIGTLEFMNIGNDIYCRRIAIGNKTGDKIVITPWFFYANLECV